MTLPKWDEKKNLPIGLWQCHCRNKGVKKKFWAIVTIPLPKMGRKKTKKAVSEIQLM